MMTRVIQIPFVVFVGCLAFAPIDSQAFDPNGTPGVYCRQIQQGGPLDVAVYICLNDWEKPTAANGDVRIVVHSPARQRLSVAIKCSTNFLRTKKGFPAATEGAGQLNTTPDRPTSTLILEAKISRADRVNWRYFADNKCAWTATPVAEPAPLIVIESPLKGITERPSSYEPSRDAAPVRIPPKSGTPGVTLCAQRSDGVGGSSCSAF